MHRKTGRKYLFLLFFYQFFLLNLFSQEIEGEENFVNDLGKDFSLSMYSLRELFVQQNDGGMDLPGLFLLSAIILLVFLLGVGIVYLILYIVRLKGRRLLNSRFLMIKKAVQKVKMDTVTPDQIKSVLENGVSISKKIDAHTGRKNSLILPVLVHRISLQMGLGEKTAAINFCASLYYDSGLLDIPGELFYEEILSRKERHMFEKHVICFDRYISDIPDDLYPEFFKACSFHHENFDGSGYPEGLSGENIPVIDRIIRVVESYLSLVSKGTYHRGLSKKNAFRDLRGRKGFYDISIVDILETLV